jgi:uncharacterized membrane protein
MTAASNSSETIARRDLILGYSVALMSALAYGSLTLVARKIVTDYASPMVSAAFSMVIGTVLITALFHRQISGDLQTHIPRRGWIFAILAGLASTWGVMFWFLGVNEAPVVVVAPLVGVYPLVSLTLTHFFLGRLEKVTRRTLVGTVLVVSGVVLVAVGGNMQS